MYAVWFCYFMIHALRITNSSHIFFGKLSHGVFSSPATCPVPFLVFAIIERGVPSQIVKATIPWIAVAMTSLHSLRPRSNKSFKYYYMSVYYFLLSVCRKAEQYVSEIMVKMP